MILLLRIRLHWRPNNENLYSGNHSIPPLAPLYNNDNIYPWTNFWRLCNAQTVLNPVQDMHHLRMAFSFHNSYNRRNAQYSRLLQMSHFQDFQPFRVIPILQQLHTNSVEDTRHVKIINIWMLFQASDVLQLWMKDQDIHTFKGLTLFKMFLHE